jgi:nitroreductase
VVREKPNLSSRIGGTVKNKDYSLMDIGIASGFITLQACAEGLGSCILGWFNEKLVRKFSAYPSG